MPSQKLGLLTADKELSGEAGVLTAVVHDLAAVEHGTTVVSTIEPAAPHAGLIWANPDDDSVQVWSDITDDWVPFSTGGDVTAHIASNPATHAVGSIVETHLAAGSVTSTKIGAAAVVAGKIAAGGVSAANQLAAAVADDTAVGNRTINDALATPANTGPLTSLLSWLAGRLKAITGESSWITAPQTTLALAKAHADSAAPHSGHETPAGAQTKVNAHAALNGAHGFYTGAGSPEGAQVASPPALYVDSASGGGVWRKNSGVGTNTGWRRVGMRIASRQTGTISLSGGNTSGTATISAVGSTPDLSLLGKITDVSTSDDYDSVEVDVTLTNSTTVTARRNSGGGTTVARFQILDWVES